MHCAALYELLLPQIFNIYLYSVIFNLPMFLCRHVCMYTHIYTHMYMHVYLERSYKLGYLVEIAQLKIKAIKLFTSYNTEWNSFLKWPQPSKSKVSTLTEEVCITHPAFIMCLLHASPCYEPGFQRTHLGPCWVRSLVETGMNRYLSQHGKCNYSGWLMEQWRWDGGDGLILQRQREKRRKFSVRFS